MPGSGCAAKRWLEERGSQGGLLDSLHFLRSVFDHDWTSIVACISPIVVIPYRLLLVFQSIEPSII